MVALANPYSAADAIPFGRRFSARLIGPPGSGKTTALAEVIGRAEDSGIDMGKIAAFAPTMPDARHLSATVVARFWPDLESDLFDRGKIGTPMHAIMHNTAAQGRFAPATAIDRAAHHYGEVIRKLHDLSDSEADKKFLRRMVPKTRRAIQYDFERRLRGDPLPMNSYLVVIAEFYAAFKRAIGECDIADIVHSACYADPDVRLLALDEVSENERRALCALYPNASVIATARAPGDLQLLVEGVEP